MFTPLDLLFPPFCAGCSRIGTLLCDNCYEQLEFVPLPLHLNLEPLYLDTVIAATYYQEPIKSLLHELKYRSVRGMGKWCGQLLYNTTLFPTANFVTAVPLHPRRQRLRGFNQAEEIAREFSKLANIPYSPLLLRARHTRHQASITDRTQRLTHLQKSFTFNPKVLPELDELKKTVPSPTVLLIDDVTTTGTTLNECAKIIKEKGFSQITGLVVAHGN